MKYKVPLRTSNWAQYIEREKKRPGLITAITIEYLPNRLTPLYFKIYDKERTI